MPADTPRLLHRHSAHGYTHKLAEALPHEAEAVPAAYQRELTADVHRREREAQLDEWQQRKTTLVRQLAWLESQRFRRDIRASLRAVRRQIDRIDKRIIDV